jgi:predicted metal-dependent hydrolase
VTEASETPALVDLAGGPLRFTLRRSPRARTLRVVIHPDRGVVVTVPARRRPGWGDPERHVATFLAQREAWLRRHLARQAAARAEIASLGGLRDGACLRYRGVLHRLSLVPGADARRSTVASSAGQDGPTLVVRLAAADRRSLGAVLEAWFRACAREEIESQVSRHAAAMGVRPAAVSLRDPTSRWGSASRAGRLSFSWRLVLAPPEALETVVIHELAHLRVFGHGPRFWAVVAAQRPDHVTWRHWLRDHAMELHGSLAS